MLHHPSFRFTLRTMVVGVAVVSLMCTVIKYADRTELFWRRELFLLANGTLLFAGLLTVAVGLYLRRPRFVLQTCVWLAVVLAACWVYVLGPRTYGVQACRVCGSERLNRVEFGVEWSTEWETDVAKWYRRMGLKGERKLIQRCEMILDAAKSDP